MIITFSIFCTHIVRYQTQSCLQLRVHSGVAVSRISKCIGNYSCLACLDFVHHRVLWPQHFFSEYTRSTRSLFLSEIDAYEFCAERWQPLHAKYIPESIQKAHRISGSVTSAIMSGGVRNLRAMFENKEESSISPPDRGRSPAGSIGTILGNNTTTCIKR